MDTSLNRYDRSMSRLLPLLVALTPFIVIPAYAEPNRGQAYYLILASLLTTVGLGIAWTCAWRPLPRRITAPGWLFLILAIASVISIQSSPVPLFSLREAMLPLCGFLLFALFVSQPNRRQVLDWTTGLLAGVAILLGVYGILQFFGFEFLPYERIFAEHERFRVVATIGHPNYLGSALGPIVFMLLALFLRAKRLWIRSLIGVGMFLVLLCLAMARTRAVWLGILIGMSVIFLVAVRYCFRQRIGMRAVSLLGAVFLVEFVMLGAIVLFLLPALDAPIDLKERILSSYEIRSRLYYWKAALELGFSRAFFGNGIGMFDPMFWNYALHHMQTEMGAYYYDVLPAIAGGSPGHVHNEYLEIFCEQGYVGLMSVLAIFVFFLHFGYLSLMRNPHPREVFPRICLFGALVMTLIDAVFGFPWRLPVSLAVVVVVLAWQYDLIYPQAGGDQPEPTYT